MKISNEEIRKCLNMLRSKPKWEEVFSAKVSPEEIRLLRSKLDKLPFRRTQRIREIKKALQEETYDISSDQIAAKLLGRIIADMTAGVRPRHRL